MHLFELILSDTMDCVNAGSRLHVHKTVFTMRLIISQNEADKKKQTLKSIVENDVLNQSHWMKTTKFKQFDKF